MKLSILPVSLFPKITSGAMSIGEWARFARSCGADGYDVSTAFWSSHTPVYIDSVRRDLETADISPVMVCTYPDFTAVDTLELERQSDYLARDIAMASAFGFRYVRITAGMDRPGLNIDAAARQVADRFRRAADTARKYNVKLVFENHGKPGAWPLRDFSFDPNAFLAVCDLLRGTDVGVNYDTANARACGADPIALLRGAADLLTTVHICDTSAPDAVVPAPLGTGLVDFDAVFAELKAIGFNNWVCIEEASGHGAEGIRDAIRFARKYIPKED